MIDASLFFQIRPCYTCKNVTLIFSATYYICTYMVSRESGHWYGVGLRCYLNPFHFQLLRNGCPLSRGRWNAPIIVIYTFSLSSPTVPEGHICVCGCFFCSAIVMVFVKTPWPFLGISKELLGRSNFRTLDW